MQGNIQDKPGTPTTLPFQIQKFTDDNTAEAYIHLHPVLLNN